MARRRTQPSVAVGGAGPVLGLDAGRQTFERERRRRRTRNRAWLAVTAVAVLAVGGAVAYMGYEAYEQNKLDEQRESERIRTELEQRTIADLIEQGTMLERGTRWAGPGVPALGVGGDDD